MYIYTHTNIHTYVRTYIHTYIRIYIHAYIHIGSSGAFVVVFTAAFGPGDRVAMASPGYPCYRNILGDATSLSTLAYSILFRALLVYL